VALCRADGVDIEAEMVRTGMAVAFVRYSRDYAVIEDQAKAEGLGMHGHGCEKPWDWRNAKNHR
jgi:endonuclease YncB( thermonuclease family)